ncbi:ADP-ribosylation factor protein 3 [Puccinia graminis f. sp. tritici]|uniref:ADP-ribosylation factor protein 3 n=1 Tax=Puccinia graminis f. sp. tritici TaxID=56615 RepID=A0A5B0QSJ3_PUCGR|nr:ADP-ribosylation factor protein 3 [Puccinia graminis f. sp. tritici]
MYRLLSGLHAHLTRKEEFNVIILGLDHAGKTTMLEKVKTIFSPSQPGLNPSQIAPTVGQNIGRITLSSTYLKFWDLGGSKDIRSIWEKYYEEADAICWVLDSQDRFRNGWKSDGNSRSSHEASGGSGTDAKGKGKAKAINETSAGSERGEGWAELQKVLQHPSIAHSNIPVLVIANKQDREPHQHAGKPSSAYDPPLDSSTSPPEIDLEDQVHQQQEPMTVHEIKEMFNRLVMESDRSEKARSLGLSEAHVLGVSAITGQGIREAINWLFFRVATKGQSRRTQQLKTQDSLLKQQQQEQQRSNPYLQHSSHDHHKPLVNHKREPSLKNNFIKLADLSKFNISNSST